MKIRLMYRFFSGLLLPVVLALSCNLPLLQNGQTTVATTSKAVQTTKITPAAVIQPSDTPVPTVTETLVPTPSETPAVTATSTLVLLSTNTPLPTFTNTAYVAINKLTGVVSAVKGRGGATPIGGASVTLYNNSTSKKVTVTNTAYTGEYQFTQIPSGQYYLVIVWVFKNASSWPCSKELLPPVGHKSTATYKDEDETVTAELRQDSTGYVLVLSTSSFGISSAPKRVVVNLLCNQLN